MTQEVTQWLFHPEFILDPGATFQYEKQKKWEKINNIHKQERATGNSDGNRGETEGNWEKQTKHREKCTKFAKNGPKKGEKLKKIEKNEQKLKNTNPK